MNKYLQPDDAPVNRTPFQVQTGVQTDYQLDRSSISTKKIKDFTFSSASGGTLSLGGAANGNGLLKIYNTAGSLIVQGDSSGLTIYDGNLLVKDASNTTIIDTSGIVSTANFPNDQIFSNTIGSTTVGTYIDVPGATMNSFILTRSTNVLVNSLFAGYCFGFDSAGDDYNVQIIDNVNGTNDGLISYTIAGQYALMNITQNAGGTITGFTNNIDPQIVSLPAVITMAPGTHTLKAQWKTNGGTAVRSAVLLGYIILGA